MTILILRQAATAAEVEAMRSAHATFIKLAVDVERRLVAGGGEMHADCEAALLEDGSEGADIWGADWYPDDATVGFESLINLRPAQDNPSMSVLDATRRSTLEAIIRKYLA